MSIRQYNTELQSLIDKIVKVYCEDEKFSTYIILGAGRFKTPTIDKGVRFSLGANL